MSEQESENVKQPGKKRTGFRRWKTIIFSLIIILLLWSVNFQVDTDSVGVVTRFGRYSRTVKPGLHLKFPIAETVFKVPVERQQKLEFGFRTVNADVNTEYSHTSETYDESLMLTGDLNLAVVEWVVQYRIDNAYNYLFKVRNPQNTLRDISEAAMRQIIGDRTANEVLTVGRNEIISKAKKLMQSICTEYSMGVKIEGVMLQDINPPDPVKDAFNDVNAAQQERETLINQAKSDYNKSVPRARGQAEKTVQQAEGYAIERINNAKGDVSRFQALYKEYIKAPEVTRRRIYLETMSDVIPKIGNVIITDQKGSNILPLLQMTMNNGTLNSGRNNTPLQNFYPAVNNDSANAVKQEAIVKNTDAKPIAGKKKNNKKAVKMNSDEK